MSHFIDTNGGLHWLDNDLDRGILLSDCVKITDAEAEELSKPSKAEINAQRKAEIFAELDTIDAKSIRPIREGDTVRLSDLDKQAQVLRDELKALAL